MAGAAAGGRGKLTTRVSSASGGRQHEHVEGHRVPGQGVEVARSRRPELICFQLKGGSQELTEFTDEVNNCSPESVVVATYRSEDFETDASESEALIEGMRHGVADIREMFADDIRFIEQF